MVKSVSLEQVGADSIANQPVQQTASYGTLGNATPFAVLDSPIQTLTCWSNVSNNKPFVQTLVIAYANGVTVSLGQSDPQTYHDQAVVFDLAGDTVARMYIFLSTASIFGGASGIGGIFVQTVRGKQYCSACIPQIGSLANTPFTNPSAWTIVSTSDSPAMPCNAMVLVGVAGAAGSAINQISFYYKTDKLVNQGLKIDNSSYKLQMGEQTPLNVAQAIVANQTDRPQQMSVIFQEGVLSSFTFSTTAGVTTGVSTTISGGIPFSLQGTVQVSASLTFSATLGVAKTFSDSFSYNAVVAVGPQQIFQATAVASSAPVTGTFSAEAAEVWAYAGAVTQAVEGIIDGVAAYDTQVVYADITQQGSVG